MKDHDEQEGACQATWNWPAAGAPTRGERDDPSTAGTFIPAAKATNARTAAPGGAPYPVWDPARTYFTGAVACGFYEDGIVIEVSDDPTISQCRMRIELRLSGDDGTDWYEKEVAEWNEESGLVGNRISAKGRDYGLKTMVIDKSKGSTGCDTVVLSKGKILNFLTPMYSFRVDQFWSHWGGKRVRFTWVSEDAGSGVPGDQTAFPDPWLPYPDRTLLRTPDGTTDVCVGGSLFRVRDAATAASIGLDFSVVQDISVRQRAMVSAQPVDFTYLREPGSADLAYIVFGRAKFPVTRFDSETYFNNWPFSKAVLVPDSSLQSVPEMPVHGTLLQESTSATAYAMVGGVPRQFSGQHRIPELCYDTRRIRWVPPGALDGLPKGPPL